MYRSHRFAARIVTLILLLLSGCASFQAPHAAMPEGFTYLAAVDASVIQSPRYYGTENFLARRVLGYTSPQILCATKAAQALSRAQKMFASKGYSLVVYDAYRPQRSVNEFMRWSTDMSDQVAKGRYYPTIDKKDVFDLGYVAKKSGHSRGSTFDVSLIKVGDLVNEAKLSSRTLLDGSVIPFLDDNTIDMGSSFDLFHPVSHHDTPLISDVHTERRNLLRSVMKEHGFKEYSEEWWHYTLVDEPFPNAYFDFTPTESE